MGTTLDTTVTSLNEKLARLEAGPSVAGDWHRLEAAAARGLIAAQNEIAGIQADMLELVKANPPDRRWYAAQARLHTVRGLMDDLRLVKLCAQSRLFEIEAEANQTDFRAAR